MNAPAPDPGNTAVHAPSGERPACPQCAGPVSRIPRRLVDRIGSLFKPVHRYRCRSLVCSWEGNLPVGTRAAAESEPPAG